MVYDKLFLYYQVEYTYGNKLWNTQDPNNLFLCWWNGHDVGLYKVHTYHKIYEEPYRILIIFSMYKCAVSTT